MALCFGTDGELYTLIHSGKCFSLAKIINKKNALESIH